MSAAPQPESHYDADFSDKQKNALTVFRDFEAELDQRAAAFTSMLPSNLSLDRFKNTVIAAAKQNPDLFKATARSLFGSITRAAQDGLVPDGREGVITIYNTEIKAHGGQPARWEKVAQWNPMAHGLRKRLRELDHLIVDVQVVHDKDHFIWHQGDEPRIEHVPAKLGTPRGDMIGAYAIFKREDGTILHREVMDKIQIEMTRNQSKAKDSLMWTKFASEGYRKSVLRRGVKTVPVTDTMQEIIKRDDDANFDFEQRAEAVTLVPPPAPPPVPESITEQKPEVLPQMVSKNAEPLEIPDSLRRTPAPKSAPKPPRTPASIAAEEIGGPPSAYQDWIGDIYAELEACETTDAVDDLRERALNDLEDGDKAEWKEKCADRATAIFTDTKRERLAAIGTV